MGNSQSSNSKKLGGRGLMDPDKIDGLSYLEDGQFAKVYKGHMPMTSSAIKQTVSIKVPRVPDAIRKDKRKVKTHIEEARKLLPLVKRHGLDKGIHLVKYFGVAYDDFRKEVWVVSEYVDGLDLETLMKNPSLCPALRSPEKRMGVAVGVARGINYLHCLKNPVVHGDLVPSDVIIPSNQLTQPKIRNFGLWDFKKFFVDNTFPDQSWSPVLTNPWQAPELLIGRGERPSFFSDAWSLAATLLQWLTEQPGPWDLDQLCTRYGMRRNRMMAALMQAMEDGQQPSVLDHVAEYETQEHGLTVIRSALNYEPTSRPPVHKMESELVALSRTPTWTNIAYQRYYGQ